MVQSHKARVQTQVTWFLSHDSDRSKRKPRMRARDTLPPSEEMSVCTSWLAPFVRACTHTHARTPSEAGSEMCWKLAMSTSSCVGKPSAVCCFLFVGDWMSVPHHTGHLTEFPHSRFI